MQYLVSVVFRVFFLLFKQFCFPKFNTFCITWQNEFQYFVQFVASFDLFHPPTQLEKLNLNDKLKPHLEKRKNKHETIS